MRRRHSEAESRILNRRARELRQIQRAQNSYYNFDLRQWIRNGVYVDSGWEPRPNRDRSPYSCRCRQGCGCKVRWNGEPPKRQRENVDFAEQVAEFFGANP